MQDVVHLQRKVTIRLSPYQARKLQELRTAGLPEGATPRTATQVIVEALMAQVALRKEEAGERQSPLRQVG